MTAAILYIVPLLLFAGIFCATAAQRSLPNDVRVKYSNMLMLSAFGMWCTGIAFGILSIKAFGG
jgi:hypothetical protein